MITLNASGGSVTFTFSGNSTYLNDGTIEVPVNSLALIIDESDMVTFKKSQSSDIFVSANIAEFGMTKAELESWFKENGVGGDVTSGEVQTMIDNSISGKADSSAVTEEISAAVSGKANTSYVNQRLSGKVDNIISTGERVDVLLTGASSLDNWPLIVGYDYVLIPDSIYIVYGWGTSGVNDFSSVDGGYLRINAKYTTSGYQEEYESIDGKFRLPVADIDTTKVNRIYTSPDGITVTLVKEGNDINATEEIKKISGKTDTSAFTAHTSDTTVHVTSAEKSTWSSKANVWSGDETAWGQISGGTLDSNTLYLVY